MQNDALVSAPLIVAAVFVASAIGKLMDPHRAASAFDALEVPRALARPWMRAAHPWVELVIALCLVVTSGLLAVGTAVVTAALALVYLGLIMRALRRPEPTDCACFGAGGSDRVSSWTVVRNVWLLALCAVCVWAAMDGRSPLRRVVELGSSAWWLAAVLAAVAMTALIMDPSASRPAAGAADLSDGQDLDDYVRVEIPHAPVTMSDGTVVSLKELARTRPQLIVAVSGGCSSCVATIETLPRWRERLPEVSIHSMYFMEHDDPSAAAAPGEETVYDPKRFAFEALRLPGTPSAVLLGADGLLAGGPVAGHGAICTFVEDIETELAGLRALATSAPS